jgi:hypothetical protein
MKYLFPILFLLVLCCRDECNPESTRCQEDNVQICNSEGDWTLVIDCTTVSPDLWECCVNGMEYETTVMATCVILDTCETDGGLSL